MYDNLLLVLKYIIYNLSNWERELFINIEDERKKEYKYILTIINDG